MVPSSNYHGHSSLSHTHRHVRPQIEPHLSEQVENWPQTQKCYLVRGGEVSLIARITQNYYYYACNLCCWKIYLRFRFRSARPCNQIHNCRITHIFHRFDIIALYTRLSHLPIRPSIREREMALTTTTTLCDKILPQRMCVIEKWTMCYWRLLQAVAATTLVYDDGTSNFH